MDDTSTGGRHKPAVLAACPAFALPVVEDTLREHVALIPALSLSEAQTVLEQRHDIALALCALFFDESRMYELLRYMRQRYPAMPFVCCRILDTDLSRVVTDGVALASLSAGAAAFVDFARLKAELGEHEAKARLRATVLEHLAHIRTAESPKLRS